MATRKAKTTKTTKPAKTTRPAKKADKTTKKVTAPKATKKTAEKKVIEKPLVESTTNTTSRKLPSLKLRKGYVIAAVVLVVLLGLAFYYRSLFVVATVNGQPISRLAYIQELERMSGQQAMNALVTKNLILQEAEEKNVTVADDEVNKEIAEIEKNLEGQGQNLDSVLTLQGLTRDALSEQIYLQKLIEKMVGENVKIADEEVTTYIENNQATLPEGQSEEEQQTAVREQLRQQKLNEQVQTWLQELQQSAQINYLISQ